MAKEKRLNPFFILVFLFLLFGLMMIADVSLLEGEKTFGDQLYFLKRQLIWTVLGGGAFFFASRMKTSFWQKIALPLFVFSLIPLALVLLPSVGQLVWGARRWINIAGFNFQPSELMKTSLLLFSAVLMSRKEVSFSQLGLILFLPVFLTVLEPDFGTSAIMTATIFLVWFLSGAPVKKIVLPALFFLALGATLIYFSPYRRERVKSMIDPFFDPQGSSYHTYQLVLTLGSGGLFGVGMGQSRQKYQYLPQVTTDSIMAVVGEELGLIGLSLVLIAFLALIVLGLRIALKSKDQFGRLFTAGLITLIAVQGLINLSAVAIVLPLTGVPFPLVSYGGSSLVLTLFSLGIVYRISQNQ